MRALPFSSKLFFGLYRTVVWPLGSKLFRLTGIFHDKIRRGLQMRQPRDGKAPWLLSTAATEGSRPIWFHCASGEFEYAKPVITRLKNRDPKTKILVTYFSPSVHESIRRFPGVDLAFPTPWETPKDWQEFIALHKPFALCIARTDVWPEMTYQAKKAQIPTLLFSATLAAGSGRTRGIGRWASRATMSLLDSISCVSDADLDEFRLLGLQAEIGGDTRYDQVQERLKEPRPLKDSLFQSEDAHHTLVAGSTWSQDEDVLLRVSQALGSRLRLVLVPHEPTPLHLQELEGKIRSLGLQAVRYSSAETWPAEKILIIDQIGILAELYQKGRLAFVGGSFRKSVHSVMEPLAAGSLTFVGPYHQNNREALEFRALGLVKVSLTAEELTRKISEALSPDPARRSAIQDAIERRSGASMRVLSWLDTHALAAAPTDK